MKSIEGLQDDFQYTSLSKCCMPMDYSKHKNGQYTNELTIQSFNLYVHGVQDGIKEGAAEYQTDIES